MESTSQDCSNCMISTHSINFSSITSKLLDSFINFPELSQKSEKNLAKRIAEMLLEPEKFRELYPILEKAGFRL